MDECEKVVILGFSVLVSKGSCLLTALFYRCSAIVFVRGGEVILLSARVVNSSSSFAFFGMAALKGLLVGWG